MIGVSLAIVPIFLACGLVFLWLKPYSAYGAFASVNPTIEPTVVALEALPGNWGDGVLTASQVQRRSGKGYSEGYDRGSTKNSQGCTFFQ